MPVLVPSYIPGAFGSLPSISASDGYYQLYWLIPGTPATYLLITGTVGGSIPAYSEYDRNVQLTQNDSVLGTPAYHDLTPIYDRIYFAIGGVVYMVDSNNIGDSSSGIANSMSYVDVPQTPVDNGSGGTDTGGGNTGSSGGDTGSSGGNTSTGAGSTPADTSSGAQTGTATTTTTSPVAAAPSISAPETVSSDDVVQITIDGVVSANLKASSGKFELTGKTTVDGAEPSSFNWTAPWTDKGRTVTFTLTDPGTGEVLATASTRVEPIPDDQIPVVADTLSCPAQIQMGSLGGIAVKGSGQLILDASDGVFPDVGPNPAFAAEIDGSDVLTGVIRRERTVWIFWEPVDSEEAYTAYLFLQDYAGNTLLECGIDVVPADPLPTYPDMGPQDGSGSVAGIGVGQISVDAGTDGAYVASSSFPAAGQLPDGTALFIAPVTDDGTNVSSGDAATPASATPTGG